VMNSNTVAIVHTDSPPYNSEFRRLRRHIHPETERR